MGVQLKTCPAVAAVKGARLNMDLFVPSQDIEDWEGFIADVALKTPLTLHFLFSIFLAGGLVVLSAILLTAIIFYPNRSN